jgi:RimJ/RimL family protein N-acetyltransferase
VRPSERFEGDIVVIEPLETAHEEGLFAAGRDEEVWRYAYDYACVSRPRFHRWIADSLTEVRNGRAAVWTIRERDSGQPVGTVRYLGLRPAHDSLEIGTWLGKPWWGTGVNLETKLLLLGHAFDELGCERVELKTDVRNARSRAAIEALPAQFEGVHRRHMKLAEGWRDTASYSILTSEWPDVRATLRSRLARHTTSVAI